MTKRTFRTLLMSAGLVGSIFARLSDRSFGR